MGGLDIQVEVMLATYVLEPFSQAEQEEVPVCYRPRRASFAAFAEGELYACDEYTNTVPRQAQKQKPNPAQSELTKPPEEGRGE